MACWVKKIILSYTGHIACHSDIFVQLTFSNVTLELDTVCTNKVVSVNILTYQFVFLSSNPELY